MTKVNATLAKKRELASICSEVIESASTQGKLKQPKSMRNLRRWLRRQVIKREGLSISSNRSRLTRVATMLLMTSGLLLSSVQSAQAAPTFTQISGFHNLAVSVSAIPFTVDIDKDGDLDLFTGQGDGTITYWVNSGDAGSPIFETGTNPLSGIDVGDDSAITFVDIDKDGDFDAFVGEKDGTINYFKNIGDAYSPLFEVQTGTNNPFYNVDVGYNSAPTFADIDDDGDFDAFVMELYGTIKYFENVGTEFVPDLDGLSGVSNPLDGVDVGVSAAAAFMDMDSDGDLDAVLGRSGGSPHYYENIGDVNIPDFTQRTAHLNPFTDITCCTATAPTFGDLDADGDKDLLLGWSAGAIYYFENKPAVIPSGNFIELYEADNPLSAFDVGFESAPTFVDIDADGDLDVFSGKTHGGFDYFKNIGDVDGPIFESQTGDFNPLNGFNVGGYGYSKPTFADIDNDGDFDLFAGDYYGAIAYFKNIGDKFSPSFEKQTGVNNPLNGVPSSGSGIYSSPAFADIDNDGDLDFFRGLLSGTIDYYQNIGDADNPLFDARTGTDNPLHGFDAGASATPTFADVDGDGDLDLFSGEYSGTIKYAENTGSAVSPTFVARAGEQNPLDGFDVQDGIYGKSTPTFADIDNDGDLDAFVGEGRGTIHFFRNDPPAEVNSAPTFDSTPTISGTPQVGEILGLINTATTDVDGDNVTLSYQWQADASDISGATAATYALTANESGKSVTATITADDSNGGITSVITVVVNVITDTDGDGVADAADAFPNDATETVDTDSDGVGDNADVYPTDPDETTDTDNDGIGDNADDALQINSNGVNGFVLLVNESRTVTFLVDDPNYADSVTFAVSTSTLGTAAFVGNDLIFTALLEGSEQLTITSTDQSGDIDTMVLAITVNAVSSTDSNGDGMTDEQAADNGLDSSLESGDTDGDGTPDAEEIGDPSNPNDSDGDGIIDALEVGDGDANVASLHFVVSSATAADLGLEDYSAKEVQLAVPAGAEIQAHANGRTGLPLFTETDVGVEDSDYEYEGGLYDYSVTPPTGQSSVTVTIQLPSDVTIPADAIVRKLDINDVWRTVDDAVIDRNAKTLTFTLLDNDGVFDLNPAVGVIRDPVGIATPVSSSSSDESSSGGGGAIGYFVSLLMLLRGLSVFRSRSGKTK